MATASTSSAACPPGENLLVDRSDVGMEWVPEQLWLTHLTLDEAAGDLDYDLSASGGGTSKSPSATDAGLRFGDVDRATEAVVPGRDGGTSPARTVAVVAVVGGLALVAAGAYRSKRPE